MVFESQLPGLQLSMLGIEHGREVFLEHGSSFLGQKLRRCLRDGLSDGTVLGWLPTSEPSYLIMYPCGSTETIDTQTLKESIAAAERRPKHGQADVHEISHVLDVRRNKKLFEMLVTWSGESEEVNWIPVSWGTCAARTAATRCVARQLLHQLPTACYASALHVFNFLLLCLEGSRRRSGWTT